MLADLALQAAALFLYPGALAILVLGSVVEGGARAVLREPALASALRVGIRTWRPLPAATLAAVLLAALAATETAAPLSPVPDPEHSLMLGIAALVAATWLSWLLGGGESERGRVLLAGQAAFVIAMLGPGIATGTLHPQGVETALLPLDVVTKALAAALYLLSLPAVLQLVPAGGEPRSRSRQLLRTVLWPPYLGLFTSLFWAASPNVLGIAAFVGISLAAAAAALLLTLGLRSRPGWQPHAYPAALLAGAAVTIAVALLTPALT